MEFSPVTRAVLSAAGWARGRRVDPGRFEPDIVRGGFVFHDAARAFLNVYADLQIEVPVDGYPQVRGFVHLDPFWVLRSLCRDEVSSFLPGLIVGRVCPLGTTSGHSMYVLMDEDGATYLLDRDWSIFAPLGGDVKNAIGIVNACV